MAVQAVPTKGNLMNTKNSLSLANANAIQEKIDSAYEEAYIALQTANISNGFCEEISNAIPVEDGLHLDSRSVMGVEIPILTIDEVEHYEFLHYGTRTTNAAIDKAFILFSKVKYLTVELAEIENSVYRLADSIKKTQKRANALKNIMIPRFEETVKFIVIKRKKLRDSESESA